LKADPITHDDFIIGYQSGRLGCSVNVLRVSLLVYSGRIREKRVVAKVIGWSAGLLVLICLWVVGLYFLPLLWALLAGAGVLATFGLVCLHRIGEGILSVALTDPDFYHLVRTERALGAVAIKEGNLSLADLDTIADYIALDNPEAARRLVQRVFKPVEQLERHPKSGSVAAELRGPRFRQIVEPPCRVFYRSGDKRVWILHVMRSERLLRPGQLMKSKLIEPGVMCVRIAATLGTNWRRAMMSQGLGNRKVELDFVDPRLSIRPLIYSPAQERKPS
jgi:toxin ParE1/3/4